MPTWNHVTIIWTANCFGHLFTPSLVLLLAIFRVESCVTYTFIPGFANSFCRIAEEMFRNILLKIVLDNSFLFYGVWRLFMLPRSNLVTLPLQGCVASAYGVIECNFFESDFASFPESVIVTLLHLMGLVHCNVCVVAGPGLLMSASGRWLRRPLAVESMARCCRDHHPPHLAPPSPSPAGGEHRLIPIPCSDG